MGRLGTKPITAATSTATATSTAEPHHPTQTPPPTTTSTVITSSDPPENNDPDSISPVQVDPPHNEVPPRHNQEEPPRHCTEDMDNKLETVEVVSFPPRPSVTVDVLPQDPDKQIVVYVPPSGDTMNDGKVPAFPPTPSDATNHSHTRIPGRQSNDEQPAVMFPPQQKANPINGNDNDVAGQNTSIFSSAGSQQQQLLQSQSGGAMPPVILVPFVGVPWHSGLFDCCQQPTNAIITAFAPCVTFGQIAEILDNGSTSCLTGAFLYVFLFLVLCHWNIGVRYRRRMRNAFQIAETPVTDRIAHVMFPLCALCQEFRELQYRGLDPFQGYQGVIAGIVHGQNPQAMENVPPTNQFMTRI